VLPFEEFMSIEFLSDRSLASRLERAEATANARFVEARRRLFPELGAEWIEVAGAYAMFDGVDSPCTQTFALGLERMPDPADLDRIEKFFLDHRAPVFHEVSPMADKALLPLFVERGYHPVELSNVMFLPLAGRRPQAPPPSGAPQARVAGDDESEVWVRTGLEGWRELLEFAPQMSDLMRTSARTEGNLRFLAEIDGTPVAAGALAIHNGVALLAGASTIPEWRRRGAQRALLEARLDHAARAGCDLAMIAAEPGSSSARNSERRGFRVAYTRIKWTRKLDA
jgi:GNAT superfamily N-acetyltransferase